MKKSIQRISAFLLSICLLLSMLGFNQMAYGFPAASAELIELGELAESDRQAFEAYETVIYYL